MLTEQYIVTFMYIIKSMEHFFEQIRVKFPNYLSFIHKKKNALEKTECFKSVEINIYN